MRDDARSRTLILRLPRFSRREQGTAANGDGPSGGAVWSGEPGLDEAVISIFRASGSRGLGGLGNALRRDVMVVLKFVLVSNDLPVELVHQLIDRGIQVLV